MLRDYNLGGPLAPADYKELRKIMTINPDMQRLEPFDTPKHKLNFSDGTMDVMTGEWQEHDSADGFFSCLNMSRRELEVGRNTGAFDNFVGQIADGNPDIRRQLLELVGLALTGCNLKHFFVLVGPSHTGKTQFGRFLGELVGQKNVETLRGIDDFGVSEIDFSRSLSQAVQGVSSVKQIKRAAGTECRGYKGLRLRDKNRD